ncbi:hypothetical protein N7476_006181 [Penicillium atrosanguineum]|uniref:Nuclear speckle splicing regulatory protein 1 N-terminal domain-containing protein n=1 Tax=Penicillium atrosanguineum TaxID=1132637 RepID=A0A9W9U567_9EURO|nr:hypothetical protein N7526_009652 [Penicillium atrosanguineum]KAJ5315874.1 hypothetical protein N7476_006181 [Penicillium atrosanguineum]
MAPQFGLSLTNKKPSGPKPSNPLGQKRKKNIFDDDSEDENQNGEGAVEVSTLGGFDAPAPKPSKPSTTGPPPKRKMQLGSGKPSVKPLNKSSIFADDEDEDEQKDKDQQGEVRFGLNQAQSKQKTVPGKDFTNLSAMHSSKKHAKEAEELNPSIYSYDTVYDSLHAKTEKSATADKSETPKYMENLLRSAEIRKRDQLRARDRQLAKEREAEGDEFADKDAFVTSAYKAQQAEMRKVEEEEARREKEEEERKKQNGGAGMVGFYRDVLSRGEAKHEEAVKAAEEAARRLKAGEATEDIAASEEKSEAQKADDLNARGARVAVNDEGQVVDKRQLLSAGLNVAPKLKTAPSAASTATARPAGRPGPNSNYQSGRAGQRSRQTEMITRQLEQQARQEEEAEAARQKEIAEKARSQKTVSDVSSAKERYLARKREREEAAAKQKANAK